MLSFHVTVEYQESGAYCRLGLFQPAYEPRILAALAPGKSKLAGRGVPRDAAFQTWLSLQEPVDAKGFSEADMGRIRTSRLVGFDCSHLVRPRSSVRDATHLLASELAKLCQARKVRDASWKALQALLEGLPGGRIVCWLQE